MRKFWCDRCQILFSDKGKRKEWTDKIYGPCHKWVAFCPKCKDEVGEYNPPGRSKSKNANLRNFSCKCGNCG